MADSGSWSGIVDRLRTVTEGEFIIGGELGRGGMAAVFLAYDVKLNRRVAIKVMSPALLMGEGLVQRFMDEAVMMANLRHPNIITVHAVREVGDLHFFVMQFVNGRPLDHVIQHAGTIDVAAVRAILWQVGSALSYAHRHGVIHRDIKPANILIDADGNALVTDFGIAKAVESSKQTQTGVLVGTPLYMSPEQCYGQPVSAMTDQYSLGIVAYELLTHSTPFSGSGFKIMQAHTGEAPRPPRELRPDIPEGVERAILRMLAKEPHERWPSIRDSLSALGAGPIDEADPVRATLARFATLGEGPAAARDPITPAGRVFDSGGGVRAASQPTSAPPEPHQLYLIVADPPDFVEVGDEVTMTAVVCREKGTIVANSRITWATSDYRIATIDQASGRLKARAAGVVSITASADGLSDVVDLHVREAGVSGVEVTIPRGKIRVGDRVRLAATPRDKHSTPVPAPVTWSTTNVDVATVTADGELHAVSAGEVEILAEAAGIRGQARLAVLSRQSVPAAVQPANGKRTVSPLVRRLGFVGALAAVALAGVLARNWLRDKSEPPPPQPVLTDAASGSIDAVKRAGVEDTTKVAEGPTKPATNPVKPALTAVDTPTGKTPGRPKLVVPRPAVKETTTVQPPVGAEKTVVSSGATTTVRIQPPAVDSPRARVAERLTDAELREARDACIAVLQKKDVSALPAMYRSASAADRQNEATLKRLMEDGSARLAFEAPTLGATTIEDAGKGAAEFTIPMRWRTSFGSNRSTSATFRAEVTKDLDGWHGAGCRIVGTPRLQ